MDRPRFAKGQFILQGVIVVGDARTAMLREKTSGKVHRVEKGKEINGVTVFQIDPQVVTIGIGDDRETLPLTVQRAGGPAPVAPTASVPPPPGNVAQGPFGPQSSPFPQPGQQPGAPNTQQQHQQPPTFAGAPPFPSTQPPGALPVQPPVVAPGAAGAPQASTAPMSPEELLARRRARRAQQNQ